MGLSFIPWAKSGRSSAPPTIRRSTTARSLLRDEFMKSAISLLMTCITALTAVGCSHDPQAGLKAELADKKLGTNDYWMKQPPVAQATSDDFERLWHAARRVAMDRGFGIDRVDVRDGV